MNWQRSKYYVRDFLRSVRRSKYVNDFLRPSWNRYLQKVTCLEVLFLMQPMIQQEGFSNTAKWIREKYLSQWFKPLLAKFCRAICDYATQLYAASPMFCKKNNNPHFVIHVCCWGKSYLEKMRTCFIPSLLAKNNLPSLSKEYHCILLIHCTSQVKRALERTFPMLDDYCEVHYCIIPRTLLKCIKTPRSYKALSRFRSLKDWVATVQNLHYYLLGLLQTHALEVARLNNSYVSFLMPDFILSDSFLLNCSEKIKDKVCLFAVPPSINYDAVKAPLQAYYSNTEKTTLTISSNELGFLKQKSLHPALLERIISPETCATLLCAQFLFYNYNRLILRSFHYHPILLNASKMDKNCWHNLLPIDSKISDWLESLPDFDNQIWTYTDDDSISCAELSDASYPRPKITHYATHDELIDATVVMIRTQPLLYSSKLGKYLAKQKCNMGINLQASVSRADDVIFFAMVGKRLIQHINKVFDQFSPTNSDIRAIENHLTANGYSRKFIFSTADCIGGVYPITEENIANVLWFAQFLTRYFQESEESARLYLKVIETMPYCTEAYIDLLHSVQWHYNLFDKFDFVSNIFEFIRYNTPFTNNKTSDSLLVLGQLLTRIGRLDEAKIIFQKLIDLDIDPASYDSITKLQVQANYHLLELQYLTSHKYPELDDLYSQQVHSTSKLIVSICCYGDYIDQLCGVGGSTLFCKQNKQIFSDEWDTTLLIFCKVDDKVRIERSKFYEKISSLITVHILIIPENIFALAHHSWVYRWAPPSIVISTLTYIRSLEIAKQHKASLLILPGDAIYANTIMSDITNAYKQGCQIIFTSGMYVINQTIKQQHVHLSLSPEDLVRFVVEHPHPMIDGQTVTGDTTVLPGIVLWKDGNEFFGHFFMLHPVFMSSAFIEKTSSVIPESIDGSWVYALSINHREPIRVWVTTQEKNILFVTTEGQDSEVPVKNFHVNTLAYEAASWLTNVMTPLHVWLFTHRLYFSRDSLHEKQFPSERMDNLVKDLLQLFPKLSTKQFPFCDFESDSLDNESDSVHNEIEYSLV